MNYNFYKNKYNILKGGSGYKTNISNLILTDKDGSNIIINNKDEQWL